MALNILTLYRMTPDLSPTHPSIPNGGSAPHSHALNLPDTPQDDLTPVGSPVGSPILGHRSRLQSVSNPAPVICMVAQGLVQKADSMLELLEDRLLTSTLEDAEGIVKPDHKGGHDLGCAG